MTFTSLDGFVPRPVFLPGARVQDTVTGGTATVIDAELRKRPTGKIWEYALNHDAGGWSGGMQAFDGRLVAVAENPDDQPRWCASSVGRNSPGGYFACGFYAEACVPYCGWHLVHGAITDIQDTAPLGRSWPTVAPVAGRTMPQFIASHVHYGIEGALSGWCGFNSISGQELRHLVTAFVAARTLVDLDEDAYTEHLNVAVRANRVARLAAVGGRPSSEYHYGLPSDAR